jgi:hypothetical protein
MAAKRLMRISNPYGRVHAVVKPGWAGGATPPSRAERITTAGD